MVAVLVLEDRDGCKCAWNVAEGFGAGAEPISGLAGAAEGGRPDSAAVMGVGRSPRAHLRSQPHCGGAWSRLLRLEERAEGAASATRASGPAFVELPTPVLASKQCLFELDNGTGTTMRVQLTGYDAADVEALARGF